MKNVSINSTEYITIESGEDIKALNINVQEIDISNETIRNISSYTPYHNTQLTQVGPPLSLLHISQFLSIQHQLSFQFTII